MEFFSVVGAVLVGLVISGSLDLTVFLQRCFPLTTGVWWYMCVYFATMSISPILNRAVQIMSKKESFAFLVAMLLFCSIIPFFTKYKEYLGVNLGYSFIWFIVLYYTGAVMCKYFSNTRRENNNSYLYLYIGLAIFNVVFSNFTSKIEIIQGYRFTSYNSVILYAQAIFIFFYFKNLKIKSPKASKIISNISGLSLAAYIFHCQTDISRTIWELLNPSQYANSLVLIPIFVITILSIFFVSIVIEYIRRKLFSICNFENRITKIISDVIQKGVKEVYFKFDNIESK
jgi:hypothetical protein